MFFPTDGGERFWSSLVVELVESVLISTLTEESLKNAVVSHLTEESLENMLACPVTLPVNHISVQILPLFCPPGLGRSGGPYILH